VLVFHKFFFSWLGLDGEPLMADIISSLGEVAISSSSGVIWIVFAGGTAFRIVPLLLGKLLVLRGLLLDLDLELQRFGFSDISCFWGRLAWTTKVGPGSGVSVPLLLKIETLLLAIGLESVRSTVPCNAVPSNEANCAVAAAMLLAVRTVIWSNTRRQS
jgi:hypothetical protein